MLHSIKSYLSHPYFLEHFVLFCFSAYLLCYLLIRFLSWTKAKDTSPLRELVKDGYDSWLWGFVAHCLVMLILSFVLFYKIWQQKRLSFDWVYLPPSLLFLIIDAVCLLVISKRKQELLDILH